MNQLSRSGHSDDPMFFGIKPLAGLDMHVSSHAMVRTWVFPKEPFVEYEKKDEQWCRFFGIGHEESAPGALRVGGKFIVHPAIMEQIKKEIARRM